MRYYQLAALVSAAAFASLTILASVVVVAVWPALRKGLRNTTATTRARRLAWLRAMPAVTGGLGAAVAGVIFIRFEPADTAEPFGVVLVGAAVLLPLLSAVSLTRLLEVRRAARKCAGLLASCGRVGGELAGTPLWVVDTPYPVAAVLGVFRPRLLIATRILRECPAGEVASVIAHELAHVRRRDNLIRTVMRCLPDPLALVATGRSIERAWNAACEEAADDTATGGRRQARTQLAAALVRVAGMTERPPPPWIPALAFYEGSNLEQRVARLLDEAPARRRGATGFLAAGVLACAGTVASTDVVAVHLHHLMEFVVQVLP